MGNSTIYIKCPQCRENAILLEMQGQYFCASCMFNYTELKDDPDKLDDILIENIKIGGFGPVFAITLYQRVTLTSPAKSAQYIKELAEKNNIDLYQGHKLSGKIFDGLLN